MLSCLLVVLFIEPAQQLFEHRSHAVIGKGWQDEAVGVFLVLVGQIDARVGDALYYRQQPVIICQLAHLGVILEVLQHVAHIIAIAVQIFDEVVVQQVVVV